MAEIASCGFAYEQGRAAPVSAVRARDGAATMPAAANGLPQWPVAQPQRHGTGPVKSADRAVVPWETRRCPLLTTYRVNGTAVATPVWFVTDGSEIKLWTGARSGKVSRLRRDPRCGVAPCTYSGRATGESFTAEPGSSLTPTDRASRRCCGPSTPSRSALDAYAWLRR